jgi:hypothetical protein
MDAAATAFFDTYHTSMVKHVEAHWTSDMLLPYIIGGNPVLAREFLLWLQACENGQLEASIFRPKKSIWRTSNRMAERKLSTSVSA